MTMRNKRKCAICHHLVSKHYEDELSSHIALVCTVEGCTCIDGYEQYNERIRAAEQSK